MDSPLLLSSSSQNILAYGAAALGSLIASVLRLPHKALCALISFAAGTLFGAAFFHIIPEAFPALVWWELLIALGSGYGVFYLISHYLFICPACSASHFEEQTPERFRSIAMLLAIGLSIHSTMDGIAVSLGHEVGGGLSTLFLGVVIHKFPEGLTLCALLIQGGFGKVKSVILALILELSTVLGWFLGDYLFIHTSSRMIQWVMLHAAGGFLYLAFHAVLGEVKKHSPRIVFGSALAGALLMLAARLIGE